MEQRSNEWFEARKGRVTGSVAGAILGFAPYMTRDDVMRSMVRAYHGVESEFTGNVATEWGVNHEQEAIEEFELTTGLDVDEIGFAQLDDWLGASPDGLIGDDAILEVKCPFGIRKDDPPVFKSINDQPHYYAQLMLEMVCTDREKAYFWQWTPFRNQLEVVDLDYDWLDTYIPVLRDFYDEYQSETDNPKHRDPLRKEVNTQSTKMLVEEYEQLRDAAAQAEERMGEIIDLLVDATSGKNGLIHGHTLTMVERKGAISYANVVKDHLKGVDLEPYRGKSSEYWKFS